MFVREIHEVRLWDHELKQIIGARRKDEFTKVEVREYGDKTVQSILVTVTRPGRVRKPA